ncbi:MAG: F0F1 ATP synthase subunit B [Clostridia bacterium]|nr:F0F1 ATP synthase subunit B [Clostridia bacterium]
MQNLDVISVNLWQILISLVNLILLFLIVKKFLFKPVKKVLAERQAEIDGYYNSAADAETKANESRALWEEKLSGANEEADAIIQKATEQAKFRGEAIVADAEAKADGIIRMAENEAALERKKAIDGIKREIVDVSGAIAEKMLEREINSDDHRALIDSFIENIGDGNE